jgi:hypothetical protein
MPPRPVDREGYITTEYLVESRGKASSLARKLMQLDSKRFPVDRRFGAKFDDLLETKRKNNEYTASQMSFEHSKLMQDFSPPLEDTGHSKSTTTLALKPAKKFKESKPRQKKVCSRESLFNCILDTTVITVQPRQHGTLGSQDTNPKAKDWSAESIAIAQSPKYGGSTTSYSSS